MKKRICPQCKVANLYVKNQNGDTRLVYVDYNGEIKPKKQGEDLEGFNLSTVYCLGCSWSGSPQKLIKY